MLEWLRWRGSSMKSWSSARLVFSNTPVIRLRKPIEQHLGIDLVKTQSVAREVKEFERIDLQRALDRWLSESHPAAEEFGYTTEALMHDDGVLKPLVTDTLIRAPVERTQLDSGPGQKID